MSHIKQSADYCTLNVLVAPRAKQTAIKGIHDNHLKISLQAAPEDGKANEALIAFISEILHIPRLSIQILKGHTSKRKIVRIEGRLSAGQVGVLCAVSST